MSDIIENRQLGIIENAFGKRIYEVREVVQDEQIKKVIESMVAKVFDYLGIKPEVQRQIMAECFALAGRYDQIQEYEEKMHGVLQANGVADAIPQRLEMRGAIMYDQISPHLLDGSVLDQGCGDARLAHILSCDGYDLELADVYRNSHVDHVVEQKGLGFSLLEQNKPLPYGDESFDNTLLLTVMHHSDNPEQVMREAQRVTRPNGRIIAIESVYGVSGQELKPAERQEIQPYLNLSPEQQRKINIFFDHFYNRVIHYTQDEASKVNVPFNFNTPKGWNELADQIGLRELQTEHLGVDQPTVPEYHTLHIWGKD